MKLLYVIQVCYSTFRIENGVHETGDSFTVRRKEFQHITVYVLKYFQLHFNIFILHYNEIDIPHLDVQKHDLHKI